MVSYDKTLLGFTRVRISRDFIAKQYPVLYYRFNTAAKAFEDKCTEIRGKHEQPDYYLRMYSILVIGCANNKEASDSLVKWLADAVNPLAETIAAITAMFNTKGVPLKPSWDYNWYINSTDMFSITLSETGKKYTDALGCTMNDFIPK